MRSLIFLRLPLLPLAGRCLLLLVAMNALFLGIRFADALVPKPAVAQALRIGFAEGGMTLRAYPQNMLLGRDQYSDCIAAQVAVLGGEDAVHTAIAPRLLAPEQVKPGMRAGSGNSCADLRRYLAGDPAAQPSATYSRFWQGGASLLAAGLMLMPVDGYRALLLTLGFGLIALAALLADRRKLLLPLAPLIVASFLLGGQFGYGQLFSSGPPQIALWALIAAMIAMRDRLTPERLIGLAVIAGALEAFFDQIISVPLIAGGFIICAGILAQIFEDQDDRPLASGAAAIVMLGIAWLVGFAGTYVIKLLISVALLGLQPVHDFAAQLAFRVGTVDPEFGYGAERGAGRLEMFGENLARLAANSWRLGYSGIRHMAAVDGLIVATAIAGWVIAVRNWLGGAKARRAALLAAGLPYIAAAAMLLLWIAVLPEHTLRHAFFMVRSFLLLLIGGWGWVACQHWIARVAVRPRASDDEAPPLLRAA